MTLPMQPSDMIVVGEVTATHGVRGDIKIRSFTDHPEQIKTYNHIYDEYHNLIQLTFKHNLNSGVFVCHINAIDNKEDAALLKGKLLYIHKSQRPTIPDDEYYLSDLINCKVIMDHEEIGSVVAFHDFGAGIFLDIKIKNEKKIGTLPFNKDAVLDIDLKQQKITISKDYLLI
jgi:16S rRNA processing protein RimM